MSATKHTAAFAGFGQSRVFRRDEVQLGELAVEACLAAIADAGLETAQIDGVVCTPDAPFNIEGSAADGEFFVTSEYVSRRLALEPRWTMDVAGTLGNSMLEAIQAVESGRCAYALLFRGLYSPGSGYGHSHEDKAGEIKVSGHEQTASLESYRSPYGFFPPADAAALAWTRYQAKYDSGSREQMADLIVQSRSNGLLFEGSYWAQHHPKVLTVEDYLSDRMVSTPVSMLDCDIPVQGAGAFIVTTADRANDLAQPAAYVHGIAGGTPPRRSMTVEEGLEEQQENGKAMARSLWADSGLEPGDIDVADLYDGFSMITMLWLESLGFCGDGEAFEFIQDGRIARTGELPVNPSGGNLGGGRLHGVNHLMDGMLQVTGRSGVRQVADAELAVVTISPPLWASGALVLGKSPA